MSSTVKVRVVGDVTPLQTSMKTASSALKGLTSLGGGATKAFGAIGESLLSAFSPQNIASGPMAAVGAITAVIGAEKALVEALIESSKAFFQDQQSTLRMDMALANNTKLTNEQIKAVNGQIDRLSILTTIQDDDLRTSYANIVASTHSATTSMKLLTLATDVSAGTGKDLTTVQSAVTKAWNGNSTALRKLIPGLKGGKEGLDQLAESYKGMGQAMGDANPFGRMKIAMDNITEAAGQMFAPVIQAVADWLTSEDFQNFATNLTMYFKSFAAEIMMFISPIQTVFTYLQKLADNPLIKRILFRGAQVAVENPIVGGVFGAWSENMAKLDATFDPILNGIRGLKGMKFTAGDAIDQTTTEIAQRIKDGADKIKNAGKSFAEALKIDDFFNKETGIFDTTGLMEKMQKLVNAAKALPARLRALRKAGASPEVLQQIVAMGPEQGLAVAQGFLDNAGSVKEYSAGLRQLNVLGQQSMAGAGAKNYTINVTKANMTAEEIITAIQKYERKTGVKVNF